MPKKEYLVAKIGVDIAVNESPKVSRNYRKSRQDSSFFSIGSQLVSSGAWALPAAGLATAGVFREEIASLIEDIFGKYYEATI